MPDDISRRDDATYGDQTVLRGHGRRDASDGGRRRSGPDDAAGRAGRGRPELAARRRARADAARGLPFSRKDLPFRSRTHSGAGRACPRLRRAWLSSRRPNRSPTSPAPTSSSATGEQTEPSCGSRRSPGNKGSADLARDVRGFAVKLYTKEGNWDIVGNNIPVFFIQDAIKFPDLDPRRQSRSPTAAFRRRSRRTTTSGTSSR